jgi:hypothetical protein
MSEPVESEDIDVVYGIIPGAAFRQINTDTAQ